MTGPLIHVQDLSRTFQTRDRKFVKPHWFSSVPMLEVAAVSDLNFAIEAGEKVAFIGPNGAGKSTTLKMLSGLLQPTSGTASVCGLIPWTQTRDLSRKVGLVFGQKTQLWPALSVSDSFDLLSRIYDLDPATYREQKDKLIEVFGLSKFVHQLARTLSLGQKMRSDIAAALLHQPSVLFLDEPTIGLDVTAKALLRDHLNRLVKEFETTVLLTSHDTDDIEKICDRVVLIDHGLKLLDTTLPELHKEFACAKTLRLVTEEKEPAFTHEAVATEEQGEHHLVLKVDITRTSIERIVTLCLERFTLRDIGIEDMPLEEIIKEIYLRKPKVA